jgi:ADP-heptose:LPS heptosyltransferase
VTIPDAVTGSVERIVVVRANSIGDFVLAVPAFRALRRAFPDAEITVVALPANRPLFDRLPHLLDRFAAFPGFPGIRERAIDSAETVSFLAWAQAQRFDLALQLQGNGVWSNPFTVLLGARFTAGFRRPEDSPYFLGLDASVVWPTRGHEVRRLLQLLPSIGVPTAGEDLELPVQPEDELEVDEALGRVAITGRTRILAVHPAGRFPDRTWPGDRFADAARRLAQTFGLTVVVTGGPDDAAIGETIACGAGGTSLATRLSLPALAALYRRATLVLTNDTGPAHIAYAVGAPSVTVFGAASPEQWGPLDSSCHAVVEADDPCRPCVGEPCIRRVPVERVVAAAEQVLRGGFGVGATADRSS